MRHYRELIDDLERVVKGEFFSADAVKDLCRSACEAIEEMEDECDDLEDQVREWENAERESEALAEANVEVLARMIQEGRRQDALDILGKMHRGHNFMSATAFDNLFGGR